MDEAAALDGIADEIAAILFRFKRTRDELWIAAGDQAKFTGLVLEARDLMAQALGPLNNFGLQLESTRSEGVMNFTGSQSFHSVEQGAGIVRAAASAIRRRRVLPPNAAAGTPAALPYVDRSRIEELRALQSPSFDLRRLVRMCEELNACFAAGHLLASAMLVRAIVDHVPPIFGAETFSAYANHIGSKSLKGTMLHLNVSMRNIADGVLHQQIRSSEDLPTASQVDFRQDLGVLLGEIVRVLRSAG